MAEFAPSPKLQSLLNPHVLMHAWKKTNRYIRRHNSVADVLELDITAVQLSRQLEKWATELSSDHFSSDPLRLVAAPKRGEWHICGGQWQPKSQSKSSPIIRPLAHPSVRDQVLATAFLICLADPVESFQGDPTVPSTDRLGGDTSSYGNRLMCDRSRLSMRFRWGNSETYRKWSTDYRAFVERPKVVIRRHFEAKPNWAEIRADLSQFYDRVRPPVLHACIKRLFGNELDPSFFQKFTRLFDWTWEDSDKEQARSYAKDRKDEIPGFDRIALPQGLVASGFFANAMLIDFDDVLKAKRFEKLSGQTWRLIDYARYVDDLRLVVEVDSDDPAKVRDQVSAWLQRILTRTAPGLHISDEKTEITMGSKPGRLIPVSDTMKLVQQSVSGPLALSEGQETLELLEGLLAAQHTKSLRADQELEEGDDEPLPIENLLHDQLDVRPDTLARFSAYRWRGTYRSLRPICESESEIRRGPSREFLDRRADVFCRSLIRKWVIDPSNVRLLRIAFDIKPDAEGLDPATGLLLQYLKPGARKSPLSSICAYIAAELFRAGATETAHVEPDALPSSADIGAYRNRLAEFALQLLKIRGMPWYLRQQAVLFLTYAEKALPSKFPGRLHPALESYRTLHSIGCNKVVDAPAATFGALCIVIAQMRGDIHHSATQILRYTKQFPDRSDELLELLLSENSRISDAVWREASKAEKKKWRPLFAAYGFMLDKRFPASIGERNSLSGKFNIMDVATAPQSPLRHEYGALQVVLGLIEERAKIKDGALTPWRIDVECEDWPAVFTRKGLIRGFIKVHINSPLSVSDCRYELPDSWNSSERWRIEIGQILRAVLTGNHDFTIPGPHTEDQARRRIYRGVLSNFEHRRNGLVSGRGALGVDWLPVSSWLGDLVSYLLRWPGSKTNTAFREIVSPEDLDRAISRQMSALSGIYGKASETALIPISINLGRNRLDSHRVRVAVVQSALPMDSDFDPSVELNDSAYRRKHRRHLRQVLDGLNSMLRVRRTHMRHDEGLELVVLPELAVHPDDLRPIIERFADQTRCIVFCGLVFHRLPFGGGALVNSGIWVIPDRTRETRNIQRFEQGKWHLTTEEQSLGITQFRPCQWILDYKDPRTNETLWRMSASICYDATDLKLAADLRDNTDAYIVAALNKDVGTFDSMAQALHYHMFQHVIVANCGQYGGSVVQAPFKQQFERTVLHHHGSEQALVSFFELDLGTYRQNGSRVPASIPQRPSRELKTPPAGYSGRFYR